MQEASGVVEMGRDHFHQPSSDLGMFFHVISLNWKKKALKQLELFTHSLGTNTPENF